jgi:hypothetical protein
MKKENIDSIHKKSIISVYREGCREAKNPLTKEYNKELDQIQKELKVSLKNLTLYMKKNNIKLEVDYNRSMDSLALKEIDKKVIK